MVEVAGRVNKTRTQSLSREIKKVAAVSNAHLLHILNGKSLSTQGTAINFCENTGIQIEISDQDRKTLLDLTSNNGRIFTLNHPNRNFVDWLVFFSLLGDDFIKNTSFFGTSITTKKIPEIIGDSYTFIETKPQEYKERKKLKKAIDEATRKVNNGTGNIFFMGWIDGGYRDFSSLFSNVLRKSKPSTTILEGKISFSEQIWYSDILKRRISFPLLRNEIKAQINCRRRTVEDVESEIRNIT